MKSVSKQDKFTAVPSFIGLSSMQWRRMGLWRYTPPFLTSALGGGEWSASHPDRFNPWKSAATRTHWLGGWVGSRADLDAVKKRKISFPCREANPGSLGCPAPSPSLNRLDYPSSILHHIQTQTVSLQLCFQTLEICFLLSGYETFHARTAKMHKYLSLYVFRMLGEVSNRSKSSKLESFNTEF
jgi:hypothetical protein